MTYGIPTSSRSRSTRCSAGPPGSAARSPRRRRARQARATMLSGGTIVAALVQRQYHQSAPGAAHFEDGTVNYLNLPAVEIGLCFLDRIGIQTATPASPRSAPGSSTRSERSGTAMAHPPRRSTACDPGIGTRRSRSTSCIPTAAWSTSATSTASPAITTSRFALTASATPTPVRSHSQSRAKRSPGRVRRGDNARRPHPGTRPALRRGRVPGPHSAWPGRRRSASIRRIHRRVHRPEERSGRSSATRELLS